MSHVNILLQLLLLLLCCAVDENPILSIIGGKGKVRKNIFTFGDLAGSERLSKSGASSGAQLKVSQSGSQSVRQSG